MLFHAKQQNKSSLLSSRRTGKLSVGGALDLIGYLPLETHTVPLLKGLGFLEAYYKMLEKRTDHDLTLKLRVRNDDMLTRNLISYIHIMYAPKLGFIRG